MTSRPSSARKVKSGARSPSRKSAKPPSSSRRAVGVVRVSRVGARSGEQFVSPSEQAERIRAACAHDGLELVETIEELDVSGGAPLVKRIGLSRAVELVEAREAEVVVVAYLDRLVRSITVQAEVVSRVEAAGGAILAVDFGTLSHGSSAQWLSGTLLGAVSEYHRRVTGERTADAKRRAVERGVPPFAKIPPGYRRDQDSRLKVHKKEAAAVKEAFRRRAAGATVMDVRAFLRKKGIERSFHGVQSMLTSRIYLGELHFGDLVNQTSHPAIVDVETWACVQKMRSPRGRRAKSERLLARLGILRCATCGGRMVVGTANRSSYYLYRCPPNGDCPRRVTISATIAEQVVVDAVRASLAGIRGTASFADGLQEAERDFARAEQELNAAVEAFTGLEDVAAARTRLLELRDRCDAHRDRLADLQAGAAPAITVSADDWPRLNLEEQRALIRAVVESAVVAPGRGSRRITVNPHGAVTAGGPRVLAGF